MYQAVSDELMEILLGLGRKRTALDAILTVLLMDAVELVLKFIKLEGIVVVALIKQCTRLHVLLVSQHTCASTSQRISDKKPEELLRMKILD
ncbi:hypothetical protein KIN20_025701 [Parelaphostrongylus tenuis]|uniref:Uncharacterized protein n=1 Tax=Parelaphostrongylus tenuis TaxID=148309 RepID=A0AAD5QXT7_PARTN|nr:hypothetical protein KIN20_025701 [Parelaphostrongylus tenuis]